MTSTFRVRKRRFFLTSDSNAPDPGADLGLLSPAWAGTPVALETADVAVLQAILDAEVALAAAQARSGLVPEAAAAVVRRVAADVVIDIEQAARRSRSVGNPIIPILSDLRAAVASADPGSAGFVHLGATSQDILDTALMLVAQRSIRILSIDLDTAVSTLAGLANRHRATVMAGRTLTQHSVPTTFGLKVAGWLVGVVDATRALTVIADALPAQLGGAAGTLASFGELAPGRELAIVDAFAAELGLRAPTLPWHTHRAPITRLGDALAGVCDALGKIAADISLLSRTEIAELHEASGGGSSAMPQKQNPVLSVLMQAAARKSPGLAAELHRSALAVDERPDGAWHVEWQTLRELLRVAGGAASLAAELLPGLRVDRERMRANLLSTGPLIVGERIMLVAGPVLGMDRVKQLVVQAADDSQSLQESLHSELAGWSDERLTELLDPLNYLGASEDLIDRALRHTEGTP
jgi:3-carboxy-cis,cis-muconate cycloisomerase